MRTPDDESLFADMLLAAREARDIASGRTYDDFMEDRVPQLALERLLAIIGEAASHLSPEAKQRVPTLPWSQRDAQPPRA